MCHVYSIAKCKGEFAEDMNILEHLTSMLNSIHSSSTRNKQSCGVINELITQLEKCSVMIILGFLMACTARRLSSFFSVVMSTEALYQVYDAFLILEKFN